MSGDAASLPCPICSHKGVFDSPESMRDRLIHVSTNKILCPVCQEEICGLDKLTIHLFSHVKPLSLKSSDKNNENNMAKEKNIKHEIEAVAQQKKPRSCAKNKPSCSIASAPVKYVKIYPKLPVISVNTLPILDVPQNPLADHIIKTGDQMILKTEPQLIKSNTTCNLCSLQFVDENILKMHRCLIHNIDDTSSECFTRYNCHICPKNFKMRGSLMVHLRVAHYGFPTESNSNDNDSQDKKNGKTCEKMQEKPSYFDRTDNKQWQCDDCKKYFTTKYFLKKHKRLHTGETPYACVQCNKTFTFQQSYHKHLLYHKDEKPHSCTYCGRAFKELSTLHNHQRIHTGEKPFACETCGKCFRQRVSYLVHRRIHTGVMPYKCTACQKSFRYKVSQRTHKCQVQPPGTVIRQIGELVEKLKKNHTDPESNEIQPNYSENHFLYLHSASASEISEANAELARTGAKLSLEDMETENFRIFDDTFHNETETLASSSTDLLINEYSNKPNQTLETNLEELINVNPVDDKSLPSPSDILRNLCLSRDDDYALDDQSRSNHDLLKDFSHYL